MSSYDESYPGGYPAMTRKWQKRRLPLTFLPHEALPPLDVDLDELERSRITEIPEVGEERSIFTWRKRDMAREFFGNSGLAYINGLLIIALRKREWPAHAPALFNRIWREKGQTLIVELNRRWLISSVITFADHGETEADRRVGHSLNLLFSLMKLYETERLYSGRKATDPFDTAPRAPGPLPMGMPMFDIVDGDLDINLLVPIRVEATAAPVAGPVAGHLLNLLNHDESNLFRRLAMMRAGALDNAPTTRPNEDDSEPAKPLD